MTLQRRHHRVAVAADGVDSPENGFPLRLFPATPRRRIGNNRAAYRGCEVRKKDERREDTDRRTLALGRPSDDALKVVFSKKPPKVPDRPLVRR